MGSGKGLISVGLWDPLIGCKNKFLCVPVSEFGIIWFLHIRTDFLHGEL